MSFSPIEEVTEDIKAGKMVIVCDDEDRENEGDLTMAAELVRAEDINFMATYGRGLICLPMHESIVDGLQMPRMEQHNAPRTETAFTVSIEAREGVESGISAADRARTVRVAIDAGSEPEDLIAPGHVFPLRARSGGVLERPGQTEAAVDLARLAGLRPAGVICEIMNEDGTMARVPDLEEFSKRHGIKMVTVAQIIDYRRAYDDHVRLIEEQTLATGYGKFRLRAYESENQGVTHLALLAGQPESEEDGVPVYIHHECLLGDVLGSVLCDCRKRLEVAINAIAEEGVGVVCYVRRGQRGADVLERLGASHRGEETPESVEEKDYRVGVQILKKIGLERVRLMKENPAAAAGLRDLGLEVVERLLR